MKKTFRTIISFLTVGFVLCTASCSSTNWLQEKYGDDSFYFDGLVFQKNNDLNNAKNAFKKSADKSSPFFARLAEKELCSYGTRLQQIQSIINYQKKYNDSESIVFASKTLFEMKEYEYVIKITNDFDYSQLNDETAYYRATSLFRKNDSAFGREFSDWSILRPWTEFQYTLFCEAQLNDPVSVLRSYIYKRDYVKAFMLCQEIIAEQPKLLDAPQLMSDAGKAYYYGSTDYLTNAYFFDTLTEKYSDKCGFYINFYTGRLFSKNTSYRRAAGSRFFKAMSLAQTELQFDNALWYLMDNSLNISVEDALDNLKIYASQWHDPSYFDDFFETLSLRLISKHMWSKYNDVAKIASEYGSGETAAKYSYILARLIDLNYFTPSDSNFLGTEELYISTLKDSSNVYYKVMSGTQLGLNSNQIAPYLVPQVKDKNFVPNGDAEKYLYGLLDYGLQDNLFEKLLEYENEIGFECSKYFVKYIHSHLTPDQQNMHSQILRFTARKIDECEIQADKEFLQELYPKNFSQYVDDACKTFDLPDYLLYALIRSESFFDPTINSSAGAIGLTQLMEATAGDIARKLRVPQYDLTDAKTNITFGAYYLSELIGRLDNSQILSCFAYNAGITRVRNWVRSANLEFNTNNLPRDLFLESLPYEETREYGRKIISAASMYALLYSDVPYDTIIKSIMEM